MHKPTVLAFSNVVNLVIKHLSILYCGYPIVPLTNDKDTSAAVLFLNIISLKLLDISVENSTGYGILGMNVLGNSSISQSRFMFNNYNTLSSTNCSHGLGSCRGGNMLVFYETLPESVVQITGNSNSMVSMDSCIFGNGVDITEESSGLSIIFYIFNTVQDKFDVSKCNIVTKRSLEYKLG